MIPLSHIANAIAAEWPDITISKDASNHGLGPFHLDVYGFSIWRVNLSISYMIITLQWRHDERDVVSNHQRFDCLLNRLYRRRSKKTSKLIVTCLGVRNSPVTGEFPAQRASNAENVSIRLRHHENNVFFSEINSWIQYNSRKMLKLQHIITYVSRYSSLMLTLILYINFF